MPQRNPANSSTSSLLVQRETTRKGKKPIVSSELSYALRVCKNQKMKQWLLWFMLFIMNDFHEWIRARKICALKYISTVCSLKKHKNKSSSRALALSRTLIFLSLFFEVSDKILSLGYHRASREKTKLKIHFDSVINRLRVRQLICWQFENKNTFCEL